MSHPFQLELGDSLTLRGDIHLPEGENHPHPVLIFCHGFKGFKDWGSFPYVCDEFARQGIAAIRFNFSCNGVGESKDQFDELEKFAVNTYAREIADLRALTEALSAGNLPHAERLDGSRLFLLGHSKGGGDILLFGGSHPQVSGLISWNCIADVNLFDEKLREEINRNGTGYIQNARTGQMMPIRREVIEDVDQNREAYDLIRIASGLTKPYLIVQGDRDYARLVNGAKRLHEACPTSQLHWVEGGDHTFNTRHPFAGETPELRDAIEATVRFVKRHAG